MKSSFPGGQRVAGVTFAIGNYGYMGTGANGSSIFNDFYKYDNTSDTWTAIANSPSPLDGGTAFVINGKGYIGTGTISYPTLNCLNHFWCYNPATNTWAGIADMSGTPRITAASFAIDSVGYAGMGENTGFTQDLLDFWKYAPKDVGINEINNDNINFITYPNPTTSSFSLETTLNTPGNIQTTISNTLGQIVYSFNETANKGIYRKTFNPRLPQGMYYLTLQTEEGRTTRKMMVAGN